MKTDAAPDPTDAPAALHPRWEDARDRYDDLEAVIGTPLQVAKPVRLRPRMIALVRDWVAHTEAFLRRVLFLQALALIPGLLGVSLQNKAKRARTLAPDDAAERPFTPFDDDPQTWRASFHVLPSRSAPRSSVHGRCRSIFPIWKDEGAPYKRPDPAVYPRPADPAYDAFTGEPAPSTRSDSTRPAIERRPRLPGDPMPSAKRMEAMRRLLENPLAHAMRLARTLALKARAHARTRIVFAILKRPRASNADRWGDLMDPVQHDCADAFCAFIDTS